MRETNHLVLLVHFRGGRHLDLAAEAKILLK